MKTSVLLMGLAIALSGAAVPALAAPAAAGVQAAATASGPAAAAAPAPAAAPATTRSGSRARAAAAPSRPRGYRSARYRGGEGATWKTGRDAYGFQGSYGGCRYRGNAGPNGYRLDKLC